MARIARRGLRIKALPLFSLGEPWQSVCDATGTLGLRLFEPRYVELARRVLPPKGDGKFGYAEAYPPREGGAGILAQVENYRWDSGGSGGSGERQGGWQSAEAPGEVAYLSAIAARRFRILKVRPQEVAPSKAPLFVAHVQLLEDRDSARGAGLEAWDYWTRPAPSASATEGTDSEAGEGVQSAEGASSPSGLRARSVKAGTALVARLGAPVFESPESWRAVAQVPAGVAVVAAGAPRVVEGYLMVPIVPSGAVELTLFRELGRDGEAGVPTERELRAALLNLGKEPQRPCSETSASEERLGRKSRGRRRGG